MKKIFIFVWMSASFLSSYAQEDSTLDAGTSQRLTREQKLEKKRLEAEAKAKMVDWMVYHHKFVLEARYVNGTGGSRISVNPTTNFISIDSTNITIQLSSTSGIGGSNGIGGVTADGTVTKYNLTKLKKGTGYDIVIIMMSHVGTMEVFFSIYTDGNATAMVGGNYTGKLNYEGFLMPLKKSRIIRGVPSY
jgi:hypothetical protein